MRQLLVILLLAAAGCAQTKIIAITTIPTDATIRVDGVEMGRSPLNHAFVFENAEQTHAVLISRLGYKDHRIDLTRDYDRPTLQVQLKPLTRQVLFTVAPVPAIITIDGKPATTQPVRLHAAELEFTADDRGVWTSHLVTADHPGYGRAEAFVNWADKDAIYPLALKPMRKDLVITTTPPGVTVAIDGEVIGKTPAKASGRVFAFDTAAGQWIPLKVRLSKNGYDPVERPINWDSGRSEYHFTLPPRSKSVRIATDPPGGQVVIDGRELPRDAQGVSRALLEFEPIDEAGNLKSYKAAITRKSAESEWYPAELAIAWDDGRDEYAVPLKEILTRDVELTSPTLQRAGKAWEIVAKTTMTLAMKGVQENGRGAATAIGLPKDVVPDAIAVSPDGKKLLVVSLLKTDQDLRSRLLTMPLDGRGGVEELTDGKSLDLTPAYTLDGMKIVFSSNRAGAKFKVFRVAAAGAGGITQMTTGESNDLWPSVDADPKPRLFYQALADTLGESRIYTTPEGAATRTELTQSSATQPRISPRGDAVVYCSLNAKTGKRDIWRISDKGGNSENLTNTPDVDEFDPAWNSNGSRIAFVSDRGENGSEAKQRNYDIWTMDGNGKELTQVTTNGSWDDGPAWDPSGSAIYFRSNRGGQWGVWRIGVH